MAGDKRKRNEKQEDDSKPSKEERAVAKHLRFNTPNMEGKLHSMEVVCFYGKEAVNKMLDSKWATGKEPLFTTRDSCVNYCQRLLEKGLLHRAEKDTSRSDKKKKREEDKKVRRRKKEGEKTEEEQQQGGADGDDSKGEGEEKKEKKKKKDEDKKKKRRMRLVMSESQFFADGDEVFVWIYDPTPLKNIVIGGLLVLGAIAMCLFPLWPPEVRTGLYYVSLAGGVFVGVIFGLIILKLVLFSVIWCVTMGKHHFWLFPNLTEDVGFFESFVPLYTHSLHGEKDEKDKKKKSKDKKKGQEEEEKEEKAEEKVEETPKSRKKKHKEKHSDQEGSRDTGSENQDGSGEEEDDFEVVDTDDLEGADGEGAVVGEEEEEE